MGLEPRPGRDRRRPRERRPRERGPGHWARWRQDLRLARERLGANAFRFSIEWSRLFPRPTGAARTPKQLDRLVNERAARHYEAELRAMRRLGLKPVLTLNHFTLPSWLHDPLATRAAFAGRAADDPLPELERGGWLDPTTVREFGEFAGWAARRYGRLVDIWVTVNEPMVVAVSGYANVPGAFAAWFPPGCSRSARQSKPCATSPRRTRSPTTRSTAMTAAPAWGPCTTWSRSPPPTRAPRATGAAPATPSTSSTACS